MYIWHKETTPGTTGARCTIRDGSGLFVAECIASDAAAIVEAPAMLAALRSIGRDDDGDGMLDAAGMDRIEAILARIDGAPPTDEPCATCEELGSCQQHPLCPVCDGCGVEEVNGDCRQCSECLGECRATPTAQPAGVWRIVSGEPDTPRALYWSNCDGWGGIAGSDAFSQAERETLNLPIGGRWWFDSDDEPAAPSGEAARDMPISEATRAALVGYAEDSDMWNAPSPEMVAQLLDLAGIERRPPSNVFTAFCQEADGTGTIWIQQVKAETIADATAAARRDCAEDWGFDVEQVHCLGLARGDCQIVHWEDADD